MAFQQYATPLAIADTQIFQCPVSLSGSVHGLTFSNVTGTATTIVLKVYNQATGITTVFTSAKPVPVNGDYTWPKPINVNAGDTLYASCPVANAVNAIVAVYLDTATAPATGFNPRGSWSNIATYQINDVVTSNGSSYIAVAVNTNSLPPSSNWMLSALAITGPQGGAGLMTNKGTVTTGTLTLDYGTAAHTVATVGGAISIATTGWPVGSLGEMLLSLANGGAFSLSWPAIRWVLSDGTYTTNFAANGVTLQSAGVDFVILWSNDGGTTIYGRVMR